MQPSMLLVDLSSCKYEKVAYSLKCGGKKLLLGIMMMTCSKTGWELSGCLVSFALSSSCCLQWKFLLFSRISPKIVQKQVDLIVFRLALKILACLNLDKRPLQLLEASVISTSVITVSLPLTGFIFFLQKLRQFQQIWFTEKQPVCDLN